MKIFITGASGYIGGSLAARPVDLGHDVHGLTRNADKAAELARHDIRPEAGDLNDPKRLRTACGEADAVINAADADHRAAAQAPVEALRETGKRLIQMSGSSIIGDKASGRAPRKTNSTRALSRSRNAT